MATETSTTPGGDLRASEIRYASRRITTEDAAAVTAVLLAAIDEEASAAAAAEEPGRDAWVRSAGALRTPIDIGHGRWQRAAR